MSAHITQKEWASTKPQYEPTDCQKLFPWLHVSAVSLLSKKGLRYLLYPFISLWIVGGRISPSFTSALSMELSNNLRTKAEKRKGGGKQKHRWLFLSCLLVFFFPFHQVYFSSDPPPDCSRNMGVDWVPWQISQNLVSRGRRGGRLKWKCKAGKWRRHL